MAKDLVQIIRENPGCVAEIDNDCWSLYRSDPYEMSESADYDEWLKANELASSDDQFDPRLGDGGYGSGHCYGGDILQALAKIVGIKVGSV